ncbi:GAF domain-containing sensor histidine kinase [Mastigocoleus testarum]|uniref:histidine kinase n=1 Tax=Mastigocoleus testarum BC008 TaxID=371196 RepID=A0A0V7ZF35_9CYAN|nr:GAF domain-containing sensor histidine kinase [Mastigocoleus testarum]KST63085.1 hypothetical protein BC008_12305 [Mastigocoleus testarum BC008]KST69057.1 hypothetical protein BC008_34595 [Mastigocoleus testarum BC008]
MQLSSQKLKKQLDFFTKDFKDEPEKQKVLASIIQKILEPMDFNATFETVVAQVRQLLNADRVGIFRFSSENDWEGTFVFEDVGTGWDSILGEKIQDRCFGEKFAADYSQARKQVITDIYAPQVNDCYVEILGKFQVKANLVIPLIRDKQLWGLVCVHQCSSTREWKPSEIKFVSTIAKLLRVVIEKLDRIDKTDLIKNLDYMKQRQRIILGVVEKIHQSLDIKTILSITTLEVRELLEVDRVGIFQFNPDWSGNFVAESFEQPWVPLIDMSYPIKDTSLQETQGGRYRNNETFAINDIYQAGLTDCHIGLLEQFQAKAFAIAPILIGDKLWGLIAAYQNSSSRNWQTDEIELLAQIGSQVAVALSHHESLAKTWYQFEQQKALILAIARMRQSVNLENIFQTTVVEVRQLLKADRVAIFRFDPGNQWEGEVIHEDVALGFNSTLKDKVYDHCFAQNYVPLYRQNRVSTISDIYQQDFKQCYIQMLERFQVRANCVAPLIKEGELWGLLCIHQSEITNPINFIVENLTDVSKCTQNLFEITNLYQHTYPEASPAIEQRIQELDADLQNKDLYETLKSMRIGAKQVGQTLGLLEKFSRPDRAEQKLADITEELDNTLLLLEHRLKANDKYPGIEVVKKYDTLPLVECYPDLLNQVFIKILLHHIDALKKKFVDISQQYLKSSTQSPHVPLFIWVTTQTIDNKISIKFTDNSEGMTELQRSFVFEPEPISKTKEIPQKTELNLAICHQIVVEKHQGELKCFSQLGQGTEFLIQIPTTSTTAIEYSPNSKMFLSK